MLKARQFPAGVPALCWLALAALLLASPSRAQSPDKIIDQYLRAEGGSKALVRITAANYSGTLHAADGGLAGSYSLLLKAPNEFYSEMIVGEDHYVVAFNGKSAWAQDASTASHTLTGSSAAMAETTGRIWNDRLANWKKDKIGVRFVASETISGRPVYHLQLTLSKGITRDVFFDEQTHLLVRELVFPSTPQAAPSTIALPEQYDYSDFRSVDGVMTPYRLEIRQPAGTFDVVMSRVEFNEPVADSSFDFPLVAGRPLPDIPSLLRDIVRNQSEIEEVQKKYTCHLTEEEEETDSQGRMKQATVSEYDVFYVGGDEIRHLVAKNGKPLTGEEKQKEDDHFNKEFDKAQKKQAELAADPKKQQKQNDEDQAQISDFLRAERFTNPRRERFRGQDVIVFDFGPNPDYKPKNLVESIVQKLVGVVWVDEQARDVARLEAEFSDNAKIAGGLLASLSKGSNFVFEQAMVNNEVWLPSYSEVHASARVLFLHAKANLVDRYSDYRKFQVETRIGASVPVDGNTAPPANAPASPVPSSTTPSPN
jgi:hypothetical protein